MAQYLLRSLDLDEGIYSGGNILVVHEAEQTDGSFVLHHLTSDFVKRFGNDGHVLLVLTHQNAGHWTSVSTKLGWSLTSAEAKGNLTALDLTQEMYRRLTSKPAKEVLHDAGCINVGKLLSWCEDHVRRISESNSSGSSKILVVIDDLTSAYYNSESAQNERTLLGLLQKLVNQPENVSSNGGVPAEICIATLVSSAGSLFSTTVAHSLASVLFQVSPLQTGYSQVFHGYFTVTRRPRGVRDKKRLHKSYQYKLEDKQIQFSPLTKYSF